ncbi:hypothetical protein, partial [Rheinheimera soli]|uniref:hypothetical protein n=1 Tax=Rheinheimera soli TaxID=443616 RepID=UPI001E4BB86D
KEHFSFGILSDAFTRLSKQTISTAQYMNESQVIRLLHCPPSKLKLLLREKLLLPNKRLNNGKQLFLRIDVECLNNRLTRCLSLDDSANLLDISSYKTRQLLRAGLITSILQPEGNNRDWLIEKLHIENFISRLKKGASRSVHYAEHNRITNKISFLKHNFIETIRDMLNGKMTYSFAENKSKPFSIEQFVPMALGDDQKIEGYLSPCEASGVLGVNINAIYDFIKRGYLDVEMKSVQRTTRPIKMIPTASIQQFKYRFILSGSRGKTSHLHSKISGPKLDGCCVNVYLNSRYSETTLAAKDAGIALFLNPVVET